VRYSRGLDHGDLLHIGEELIGRLRR